MAGRNGAEWLQSSERARGEMVEPARRQLQDILGCSTSASNQFMIVRVIEKLYIGRQSCFVNELAPEVFVEQRFYSVQATLELDAQPPPCASSQKCFESGTISECRVGAFRRCTDCHQDKDEGTFTAPKLPQHLGIVHSSSYIRRLWSAHRSMLRRPG